ncbi:MAG TPA: PAS domain-containing protein, partial [Allosphingosinicella sp.]
MRKGRFARFSVPAPQALRRIPAGRRALAAVLILCSPLLVPGVATFDARPLVLLGVAAFAVLLALIGLYRLGAGEEPEAQAQADPDQPGRFVAEFEESGCGWFWETNADGLIVYVSEAMAVSLGRDPADMAGRRFAELLLVEASGESDEPRPALGFHLERRFP